MADAGKVIIACAVTGAIHTPSMSPHLPVTAGQIIEGLGFRAATPAEARVLLELKGGDKVAF